MYCKTCIYYNEVNEKFGTCDKHFTNKSPHESCTCWSDEILGGMMSYNYTNTTGVANCSTCRNSDSDMICGKFCLLVSSRCICNLWRRRKGEILDDNNFYLN